MERRHGPSVYLADDHLGWLTHLVVVQQVLQQISRGRLGAHHLGADRIARLRRHALLRGRPCGPRGEHRRGHGGGERPRTDGTVHLAHGGPLDDVGISGTVEHPRVCHHVSVVHSNAGLSHVFVT